MKRKIEIGIVSVLFIVTPALTFFVVDTLEKGQISIPTIPMEVETLETLSRATIMFFLALAFMCILWAFLFFYRWSPARWTQREAIIAVEAEDASRPGIAVVGRKASAKQLRDMCRDLIKLRKDLVRIKEDLATKEDEKIRAEIETGAPLPANHQINQEITSMQNDITGKESEIDRKDQLLENWKKSLLRKYPEYFYFLKN